MIELAITINASLEKCWKVWLSPADILQFNKPFADWRTADVRIDPVTGGRFYYRMESIDRKDGFDFAGTYQKVVPGELIECKGDDGRVTINRFTFDGVATTLVETFEPDSTTPLDLQRQFCQTILDNFKDYIEHHNSASI